MFQDVDNTAFVIGADQRIVRDVIRHRYKDLIDRDEAEENKRVVVDYPEKLVLADLRSEYLKKCRNYLSHSEKESEDMMKNCRKKH